MAEDPAKPAADDPQKTKQVGGGKLKIMLAAGQFKALWYRTCVMILMTMAIIGVISSTSQVHDRQKYSVHIEKALQLLLQELNSESELLLHPKNSQNHDRARYDKLREKSSCLELIANKAKLLVFGPPTHTVALHKLQKAELSCYEPSAKSTDTTKTVLGEYNNKEHAGLWVDLMTWPRMYSSSQLMLMATILSGWIGGMVYIMLNVGRFSKMSLLRRFGSGIGAGFFVALLLSGGSKSFFSGELEAINTSDPFMVAMAGFLAGLFSDRVFEWLAEKIKELMKVKNADSE